MKTFELAHSESHVLMSAERTTADIAWAAGLFEGEGCIFLTPSDDSYYFPHARLCLNSTDKDVVERFQAVMACGNVRHVATTQSRWKDQWCWQIGRWTDVANVLNLFLPYLGERRRARAEEVLSLCGEARTKLCVECEGVFVAKRVAQIFCTSDCRKRANRRDYWVAAGR